MYYKNEFKILLCYIVLILFSCKNDKPVVTQNLSQQNQFDIKAEKVKYFNNYGVVNENRLRFRSENDLNSKTLRYLDKGDLVRIINKDTKKVKIGEVEDFWYQIELDGITGWAFGYYLDIYLTLEDARHGAMKFTQFQPESNKIEIYDASINNNLYFLKNGKIHQIIDGNNKITQQVETREDKVITTFFFPKEKPGLYYVGKNAEHIHENGDLFYLNLDTGADHLLVEDVYTAVINDDKSTILLIDNQKSLKNKYWIIQAMNTNNESGPVEISRIKKNKKKEDLEEDLFSMTMERELGSLVKISFGDKGNFIYFKPPEENFTYLVSVLTGEYIHIEDEQVPEFNIDNNLYISIYSEENSEGKIAYSLVLKDKISGMEKPIFKSLLYPLNFSISPRKTFLALSMIDVNKRNENTYFSSVYVLSLTTYSSIKMTTGGNSYHPRWSNSLLK